jgi:cell division protein FtsQ
MRIKKAYKKTLRSMFWFLFGISFLVLLTASSKYQYHRQIQAEPRIQIDYGQGNFFISQTDIRAIVQKTVSGPLNDYGIGELDLETLEKNIRQNPYVKEAEVYTDIHGLLSIHVLQREPLLRVINRNGVSYYIDNMGGKIPITTKFTSRVIVVSGDLEDNGQVEGEIENEHLKGIFQLAKMIHNDHFLNALIDQIYINDKNRVELIPKIGRFTILLGNLSGLDEKLKRLNVFYKKGMKKVDWTKYKTIDIRFKNQIVCKK